MAVLSIGQLPGGAAAGVSDYPTTLYLSGIPTGLSASALSGSYKLGAAAGPGQPPGALTLAATGAGVLSGSYSYAYTLVDTTGGETAVNSPVAPTISSLSMKSVTVSGLPTGVTVKLYRKGAQVFRLIATLPNNSSSTYVDNAPDPSPDTRTILPQSQTKQVAAASNVYYEFAPGVAMTSTTAVSTAVASPSFAAGKGWVVDGGGRVSIPAGTWTFTTNFKGLGSGIGVAHLVIGMWKVDDNGVVVGSPLIDPTTTGENTTANIATPGGTTSPIPTTFSVGAVSLAANEHLFVEFWRHQLAANTGNPTTTLLVYDGLTKIVHPTANGYPDTPALGTIPARVKTPPTLSSTFSDPDTNDTGTLSFQLCADNACATVLQSGTASSITNGASGTFTPTSLADGTYYWRAKAQDSSSNQSDWSATNSFVIDNVAPNTPGLGTVAARVNAAPQLSASFSDVAPADTGTVSFQLCTSSVCGTVLQSTTSSMLANGAAANWTPGALADGVYYWRARAQDLATNLSGWSAAGSFTVDTIAPNVPTLTSPADATHVHSSQVTATFSEPDVADTGTVSFQLCSDAACSTVVASNTSATVGNATSVNWTPSVADGTYYWRARAADVATNASAWSAARTFILDTTVPDVPALGTIVARVKLTPQLSAHFSDANVADTGTVSLQLCTSSACSSTLQSIAVSGVANGADATWTPSALSPGTYYWRARVQDLAGNISAWSAAGSFTIDTTAPNTPVLGSLATRLNVTPQLSGSFSDTATADTGTVSLQLCSDSTCATVLQSSTSVMLANGASGSWTPTTLGDGVYYWRARAQDLATNLSGWSSTQSFTVDTIVPNVPALGSPAHAVRVSGLQLTATFSEPDVADTGTVTFQLCSDASCTTVVSSSTSATSANGASASSTPAVADGVYYWRARAQDVATNTSAWSATRTVTLDTAAPNAPTLGSISSRINVTPTFFSTYSDPDATDTGSLSFRLCTSSSCSSVLQSGSSAPGLASGTTGSWTPSSLSPGLYYWQARSVDSVGNASAWTTGSFTVDTTSPNTPVLGALATRLNVTPQLSASFSDTAAADTGTVSFQLCSDSACATVLQSSTSVMLANGASTGWTPSTLADGVYYARVRTQDLATNLSGWSAILSFTVDTVAPSMPALTGVGSGPLGSTPTLGSTFIDPGDSGTLTFQLCADAACATVVATQSSGTLANGSSSSWLAVAADGAYYARVRAADAAGNTTAWSQAVGFQLDTGAPDVPVRAGVAERAHTAHTPSLSARFSDPGGSGVGTIDFQLCTTNTCTVVLQSNTVSSIANGATATWTPETLQDGTYAWRARADDDAGNRSAWSPATTFTIDTTPPAAPTVSTERGTFRSSPLLTAGVASDTARAVVQVCNDAGCNTIVAVDFANRSATGISFQAPALPQGVYYWHALAEDDIGNSSGWSSTGSFTIDTAAPELPVVTAPPAGAPVSRLVLNGTVPDGLGKVGFKLCSDAACTAVVLTWWSDETAAGTTVHWTPSGLADGTYYWRASASDAAGNRSSWSDAQPLELDATPPPAPRALQASISKNTLALRWKTPTGEKAVSGYVLFVNGRQTTFIDVGRLGIDIRLRAGDKRTFAVAAIDEAGNVGARTRVITAAKQLPGRHAATAPSRR